MAERVAREKWYITVNCSYCGEIIPISETPPPQNYSYFMRPNPSSLTCPLCKHVDNYQPAVMIRRKIKSEVGGILKFE
jgi:hypothetical protein